MLRGAAVLLCKHDLRALELRVLFVCGATATVQERYWACLCADSDQYAVGVGRESNEHDQFARRRIRDNDGRYCRSGAKVDSLSVVSQAGRTSGDQDPQALSCKISERSKGVVVYAIPLLFEKDSVGPYIVSCVRCKLIS